MFAKFNKITLIPLVKVRIDQENTLQRVQIQLGNTCWNNSDITCATKCLKFNQK